MAKRNQRRRFFSQINRRAAVMKQRGFEPLETRLLLAATINPIAFGAGTSMNIGGVPTAMVAADFGLNGHDALAVAFGGSDTVKIFANDWDGGFFLSQTYTTGDSPVDVAVADFDRDGTLDLAVPCAGSSQITIILNARFSQTQTQVQLNFTPGACAVADFDRDGKQDILVTSPNTAQVAFLRGGGDGTFALADFSLTVSQPRHVAIADFDRDGILDAAIGADSGVVDILLGDGSGGFSSAGEINVGGGVRDLTIADVAFGATADLFVLTSGNQLLEYLGNGDGTFGTPLVYQTRPQPSAIILAQFNNDGKLDFAQANAGGDYIGVAAGGALGAVGAFGPGTDLIDSDGPLALAAVDANEDGAIDIVSADQSGKLTVYLNTSRLGVANLFIDQQPAATPAGAAVAPISVEARDGLQNLVTNFSEEVTAAITHGPVGGKIIGTAKAMAIAGVATFPNLAFNKTGFYTLIFKTGSARTWAVVEVTPGAAAGLSFSQQPSASIAGLGIFPAVKVQIVDALGNLVATDTSDVTLSLESGPIGATLGGTLTVAANFGVATFFDVSAEIAGKYTIIANSAGLSIAKSKSFVVSPDADTRRFVVIRQPNTTAVMANFAPTLQVAMQDFYGNLIKTDRSKVRLEIQSGPLGGELLGTLTATSVGGIATFTNVRASAVGDYTIALIDPTFDDLNPKTFDITIDQGTSVIAVPKLPAAGFTYGRPIAITTKLTSDSPLPAEGIVNLVDTQTSDVIALAMIGAGGTLKFSLIDIPAGDYTVRFEYEGDDYHAAGNSAPFVIKINKVVTTLALRATPASVFFGEDMILTAVLKANSSAVQAFGGDLVFMDGATVLETNPVGSPGTVEFSYGAPAAGPHQLTVLYTGDGNFKASTSLTIKATVKKNRAVGVLSQSLPNPVPLNMDVDLSLQLSVADGALPVTGNVTFKDGLTVLGVVALDVDGVAVLENVQFTTAGKHSIRAYYEGDENTNPFVSSALTLIAL